MAKSLVIKCDNCHKKYRIFRKDFDRVNTHCCCRKCAYDFKVKNNNAQGRKKSKISICETCGKKYSHYPYEKRRYCSKKCHYVKKKVSSKCFVCKKDILKVKSNHKRNEIDYCSRCCYNNRKKDGLKRIKRHTSYFMQLIEKGCECGVKEYYLLQIHHKDGDKGNNNRDNFEVVCANCHIKRHLKLNKNGQLVYHTKTLTSSQIIKLINNGKK